LILALFVGAVIFKGLMQIMNFIVCKLHGLKTLSNFDDFFLVDERKAIIGCVVRSDVFDYETMSELLKKRMPGRIAPARVRLVKMYGQHFWKQLDNEHLDKIWPNCCSKVDNVHTKE
jgi:hypothetical protein